LFLKHYILIVGWLIICFKTNAQSFEGCHFMQGNFIQIGVAPNGAFGTPQNVPVGQGYFPRPTPGSSTLNNPINNTRTSRPSSLGFVADYGKDGWLAGNPAYFGDYFMPGSVQEGWSIQSGNFNRANAYSYNYSLQTNLPAVNGYDGSLTGNLISFNSTGNLSTSVWEGLYNNNLNIKQTVTLNATKSYFVVNVEFFNNTTNPINDIYYLRTVDADCDVQFSSNYRTINKIPFSLPNAGGKSLVTSTGLSYTNAYVGLGTKDCKAVPFYLNTGLFPVGSELKDIYNKINSIYRYADSNNLDVGIGLIFEIGTLAPGEKTTIAYAYVLNENDLDDAFAATQPGFRYDGNFYPSGSVIVKPVGTPVDIEIVNGGALSWAWSPPTNLSTTIGTNVTATVDVGPTTYSVTGSGASTGRCTNPKLEIIVSPTPVIVKPTVVSPIEYCLNQVASPLQASGSGTITWYNSLTNPTGTTTPPTPNTFNIGSSTWYATLTTALGESVRVPIVVNIIPPPTINFITTTNAICLNDTLIINVNTNGFRTVWIAGASSLSRDTGKFVIAQPYVNTTYTAEVTGYAGCKATNNLSITVYPLPVLNLTANPNTTICPKDSVFINAISPTAIAYNWTPSTGLNATTTSTVISKPLTNISYEAVVTDARGCKNKANSSITISNLPKPKLGNDTSICIGDSLQLSPGMYDNYLWQNGSTLSSITAKNASTYIVRVSNSFGCIDFDTLNIVRLNALPQNFLPNDTVICKGIPLTYTINGFKSYNWSNGSNTAKSTLRNIGKYYLNVVDANGCRGVDSISLINRGCVPFQVPNAFTPNGDGKNETFKPLLTQQLSNYLFRIFNRYGQIVFETQDVLKGWNGTVLGRKQPAGTFVYQIKFNDFDNAPQLLEGSFLLIR